MPNYDGNICTCVHKLMPNWYVNPSDAATDVHVFTSEPPVGTATVGVGGVGGAGGTKSVGFFRERLENTDIVSAKHRADANHRKGVTCRVGNERIVYNPNTSRADDPYANLIDWNAQFKEEFGVGSFAGSTSATPDNWLTNTPKVDYVPTTSENFDIRATVGRRVGDFENHRVGPRGAPENNVNQPRRHVPTQVGHGEAPDGPPPTILHEDFANVDFTI
jgi:hypothetical protein